MQGSPDVLMPMRRGRRYEPDEQSRTQHRATPPRAVRGTSTTEPGRPDYGCVDWFVYEEQVEQKTSA